MIEIAETFVYPNHKLYLLKGLKNSEETLNLHMNS